MDDRVFIKVTSSKHMMRFKKKGELAPRYIRPYEIVEKIGKVAYRLALPKSMELFMRYFISYCYISI